MDGFDKNGILDIEMLQGLAQLVQDAPSGYLESDDMIQILRAIAARLEDPGQQSEQNSIHLVEQAIKVLDVMADNKVKNLDREVDHGPLKKALANLSSSKNLFLQYKALYALQALEFVPDNESALGCATRRAVAVGGGVLKITGVLNGDYSNIPDSLQQLYDAGCEIVDSAKNAYSARDNRQWYLAVRGVDAFVQGRQLADLNKYICDEPSVDDPKFQWGLCEILGKMVLDSSWDATTRSQAVEFLGEICEVNAVVGGKRDIRPLVFTIVHTALTLPGCSEKVISAAILQAQTLSTSNIPALKYSQCPYNVMSRLPLPVSSLLLRGVQDNPDLELVLERLRRQRCSEYDPREVYVEALSKASLLATDEELVSLKDRVDEFLANKREVMLILGDSGSGKSTFNRRLEYEQWGRYSAGGEIPLFIDLKSVPELDKDMIQQQFLSYQFSESHINELRRTRKILLICDGYDECRKWTNFHTNNSLNKANNWSAKMIITCRSQHLGPNYRVHFEPQASNDYSRRFVNKPDLFEEAVIVPFRMEQIKDYIDQYVSSPETQLLFENTSVWSADTYLNLLKIVPQLMDLIRNPFLLRLMLDVLPSLVRKGDDLTLTRMTRVKLYDEYVLQHFMHELDRLNVQRARGRMTQADLDAFAEIEDDFVRTGIDFASRLSESIFKVQDGVNAVKYFTMEDKKSWKSQFFGLNAGIKMLRESSPLIRIGTRHEFTHRSLMEYFYTCMIYEPKLSQEHESEDEAFPLRLTAYLSSENGSPTLVDHPFNERSIMLEPSIVHFLAERVQESPDFKDQLQTIVNLSKVDGTVSQAASNAITVLIKAGVQFNGTDLRGIQIPGADLTGGYFDSAQLQDANLDGVNLSNSWLRQANFSQTRVNNVRLGDEPYHYFEGAITMAVSPDKTVLGLGFADGKVRIMNLRDWTDCFQAPHHPKRVSSLAFSHSGLSMASGDIDGLIRIWTLQDGSHPRQLSGHTSYVYSITYSPDEDRIASGSDDHTVRIWDLSSGEALFVLEHPGEVASTLWSPDGLRLASISYRGIAYVWLAESGEREQEYHIPNVAVGSCVFSPDSQHLYSSSGNRLCRLDPLTPDDSSAGRKSDEFTFSTAISPNGQWIASCCRDGTIRVWDWQTKEWKSTLSGHSGTVFYVDFLSDFRLVSLGEDNTVRFWSLNGAEAKNEITDTTILSAAVAHTRSITDVVYSASGDYLLSSSFEPTVREWDIGTGTSKIVVQNTVSVYGLALSPEGNQIAALVRGGLLVYNRLAGPPVTDPSILLQGLICLEYSACGRWIAYGSPTGVVRLADRRSNGDERIIATHPNIICELRFSKCGRRLHSRSMDGTVQLSDTESKTSTRFTVDGVKHLAFSPCGDFVAWAGVKNEIYTGRVHIYDLKSGQETFVLEKTGKVNYIGWAPNWIATCGEDRVVRLWKNQSNEAHSSWICVAILRDFIATVNKVVWDPTGSLEFVTGANDLCAWRVVDDDDASSIKVTLKWCSTDKHRLVATGARITRAIGFNQEQRKLLKQDGAIDYSDFVIVIKAVAANPPAPSEPTDLSSQHSNH
ncbi:hypothetical protein EMPS_06544 [Entomortierella parvispora]|uniref:NACHT domain-containing protein n=1 Tax=Entomortierella parvispora TaxID=205924 RepID=A0A9P3LXB3_9FUNG|nr:hypothetical protein EMPS_06544 [Entomortierella parvispora]